MVGTDGFELGTADVGPDIEPRRERGQRGKRFSTSVLCLYGDDIKLCHWVPKGSIFLKIDQNQLSFLFGFYLKKERKKIERKKVRARPLCHPRQPTHEPFRFIGHINASVP